MVVATEHLLQLNAGQTDDKWPVVWSAPEQADGFAAGDFPLPKTTEGRVDCVFKRLRAATLNLEVHLNDGIVLNIAPIGEISPKKEVRKYRDELTEGKYEWSSIGKQLREKGLVTT